MNLSTRQETIYRRFKSAPTRPCILNSDNDAARRQKHPLAAWDVNWADQSCRSTPTAIWQKLKGSTEALQVRPR